MPTTWVISLLSLLYTSKNAPKSKYTAKNKTYCMLENDNIKSDTLVKKTTWNFSHNILKTISGGKSYGFILDVEKCLRLYTSNHSWNERLMNGTHYHNSWKKHTQ